MGVGEPNPNKKKMFWYAKAQGEYTEDGFVVFAGSTANIEEAKSIQSWITATRKKLVEQGTFSKQNIQPFLILSVWT